MQIRPLRLWEAIYLAAVERHGNGPEAREEASAALQSALAAVEARSKAHKEELERLRKENEELRNVVNRLGQVAIQAGWTRDDGPLDAWLEGALVDALEPTPIPDAPNTEEADAE